MIPKISVEFSNFQSTFICLMSFEPHDILARLKKKAGVVIRIFLGDGAEVQKLRRLPQGL